jgi:asparagine synthase (glutamine-hydrolysing)
MCGICGLVAINSALQDVGAPRLTRMRDSMVHRGPDGAGLFTDATAGSAVGLGHRRLSIVDVSHGAQPMTSENQRYHLVYNGEVFNHPEMMAELKRQGVRYRTHCDTETVLHLFERHRHDAPRYLRGMFAFAIWDRQQETLFLARDRFGVKPLYYHHAPDGTLFFASEIKALLAAGAVRPVLNKRALPDFLANHAPSGDETLFEGIRRLPPGHTLTWTRGSIEIRQYWDLSFTQDPELTTSSDADLTAEYLDRFRNAVRMRLMADVPLGMFLSGGIDSAAITAVMSQLVDERIKTFSVAFAEREANELHYARLVSDRYRTDHHEIVVTPGDFFRALPRLVWHEDEPPAHPSSIALNFVSQLASEHVKVVLTGEGSDETLAGYNRYRATILQMQAGGVYEDVVPQPLREVVREQIRERTWGVLRQRLSRTLLGRPVDLDSLYFENFAVFDRKDQAELLSMDLQRELGGIDPYEAYHRAFANGNGKSLLNRLLYTDTKTYLHELLMKQDQMSMAASIESRVPFLDHPLVEFAASMPERMKLRGMTTKWVLRQSMKDLLPAPILSRKKMGFPVPVGSWFRGEWRPILEEFILSERAVARGFFQPVELLSLVYDHIEGENHSERLWGLVTFEIWMRLFFDGESPEDISRTVDAVCSGAPVTGSLATLRLT